MATASQFILGPNSRRVKKAVSKKAWAKIVATARSRGVTVESFLSGVPGPLQERTKTAIRKDAAEQVTRSYAPVEKELNDQESRVKAISDKRSADNKHYLDWLEQQRIKMDDAFNASAAAVRQRQDQIASDLKTASDATAAAMTKGANERVGVTQDQAPALAGVLAPQAEFAQKQVAIEKQRTDTIISGQDRGTIFNAANNAAFVAAQQAKQTSEMFSQLSEIGTAKQKLALEKAAKGADLVAAMLDEEIKKADANRQFQTAAAQFGIKTELDLTKAQMASRDRAASRKLTAREKARDRALTREQKNLDRQLDRDLKATDIASRERVARWRRRQNGGLSESERRLRTQGDQKLIGEIRSAVQAAGFIEAKGRVPDATLKGMISAQIKNGTAVELAMQLIRNKGRLRPDGIAKLNKHLLLLNIPDGWFPPRAKRVSDKRR